MFARMLATMAGPPIPQRIPPLSWRKPAFVWTPLALALAIGWPAGAFYDEIGPQRLIIAALFIVFAIALATIGASWIMGRPPKSRRVVVLHVVAAGALSALLAPFLLTSLLGLVAEARQGAGEQFDLEMSATAMPLVLMLGLPVVLVSGIVFAWTALKRAPRAESAEADHFDVQPFR